MIDTNWWGRAKPGLWYGQYNAAWHKAHPGDWDAGRSAPGGFRGSVWYTATPDWDRGWFEWYGAKMPLWKYADKKARPGEIRIAQMLGPVESVRIPFERLAEEHKGEG